MAQLARLAEKHFSTDSGKRAFGGDGTHRQRSLDGKDGEQERRRGEKAVDGGCRDADTAVASDSMVASDRDCQGGRMR
jgi:hypothetical protein